jgi:hypothetical protein
VRTLFLNTTGEQASQSKSGTFEVSTEFHST